MAVRSQVTGLLTYGIDSGTSPWQAAWMIARANGNQLFFDVNGVLKQAKWPDPTQQDIAWNLLNSSAKSILFEVQRTLTTQPILGNASILPNHVIAYYETASGATPAAANEGNCAEAGKVCVASRYREWLDYDWFPWELCTHR